RCLVQILAVPEPDDTTSFARLGDFDMTMRLLPLLSRNVIIRRIALTAPEVNIYQRGNSFNFDDLTAHFAADSTAAAQSDGSSPWDVGIYDISLAEGHFSYTDLEIDAHWGFENLNLAIPGLYFAGRNTDVGAVLNFADGGSLSTELSYNVESSEYTLRMKLADLALKGTLPYFRQALNTSAVDGLLSMDVAVSGNTRHMMDFTTSGTVDLAQFTLADEAGRRVLGIDTMHVGLDEGRPMQRRFRFDTIFASGVGAEFSIDGQGRSNIAALLGVPADSPQELSADGGDALPVDSPAAAAESAAGAPFDIGVRRIDLRGGSLAISDLSMDKPFSYSISNIVLRSQDFDLAARNRVMISAQMQQQGSAMIRWDGDMSSIDNHDILVSLSNIELKDFSPYCEHFTAYPIVEGNLTYRSQNIITNRYLRGTNHLDMFRPVADKRRKDIKPEMNIPLKLGLYALKDKQGHVNIDLPVSGRIDSPEFSYRRIVMKALGNVLLKVISAPFSFMFGSGSRIDHIDIDALQQAFTSEQYAKFDRLADMLAQKPEMKLSLTQRVDYDKALIREAEMILKASYYNSMQSDSTHRLNMLDFEAIAAMPVKSNQLSAYADSLLDVRGIDRKSMKTTEKALALYGDLAAKYLDRTLQRRDSSLVRYMSTAHPSVAGSSFRVVSQSDSLRRSHRGADRYVITVEVDGESVDVASDDAVAETAPDGGSAADSLASERAEYLPEA
ncbi:MAG: DUF748 domain-containing protein, partial [Alistipes sp.]|nr:DUF748 domain-containing protein [Alistipes sp.]